MMKKLIKYVYILIFLISSLSALATQVCYKNKSSCTVNVQLCDEHTCQETHSLPARTDYVCDTATPTELSTVSVMDSNNNSLFTNFTPEIYAADPPYWYLWPNNTVITSTATCQDATNPAKSNKINIFDTGCDQYSTCRMEIHDTPGAL